MKNGFNSRLKTIPWEHVIPNHWKIRKNKYLFKEIDERSKDGKEELLSVSQYTGVTYRREGIDDEREHLSNAATLEGYKVVNPDDLVVNIMLAWNGSLGISPFRGITSPAYAVFRGNADVLPKYYHYLFRTEAAKLYFKSVSTGVVDSRLRMYPEDFLSIYSILPPIEEQTAIANFLDKKCEQINDFIVKKQKLIELLKEQKQAIINNAVTKGINPNVRMRPSDIEWLGEMPEHWEVRKLRHVAKIQNGQVDPKDPRFLKENLIAPNHIESGTGKILYKETAEAQNAESGKYRVKKGEVVYSKIRPELRKVCIAEEDGLCSADMYAIKTSGGLLPDFLKLLMLGETFSSYMTNLSFRVAMPKVNRNDVNNYIIAYPDPEEQRSIVRYVEEEFNVLDLAISKIQREIHLINEYKQSLIAETVTGKIKIV